MEIDDNILAHYGVKGMRWGRRKDRGRVHSRKKSTLSDDAKKYAQLRKKKPSQLSNRQLKTLNTRSELLSKNKQFNPSILTQGQKKVAAVLGLIGTATAVYNLQKNPLVRATFKAGATFVSNFFKERTNVDFGDLKQVFDAIES